MKSLHQLLVKGPMTPISPNVLVLLQRLIKSKYDLSVSEAIQWKTLLLHSLYSSNLTTNNPNL